MPPKIRRKSPSVIEALLDDPVGTPFFQAVRLLERAAVYENREAAGRIVNDEPVGRFVPPNTEVVRFGSQLTLGFPAGELIRIQRQETLDRSQWHVLTSFMGLTGSTGALPFHYTELLFKRLKLKDEALKTFLDLFNHRTVSLFFQAGMKYRLPLAYERHRLLPHPRDPIDNHTHALLSLIGLGNERITSEQRVDYESLLFYSGLLSQKVRPAHSIKQMLSHYFQVPVDVQEFVGQWHDLVEDVRSRLPDRNNPHGQNARLGTSAILGGKGWFAQGKIRIVLGPLDHQQFQSFAPGTQALARLNELSRRFTGAETECDYVLRVARRHLPNRIQLRQAHPPVMGWDTWLASEPQQAKEQEGTLDIKVSSARLN